MTRRLSALLLFLVIAGLLAPALPVKADTVSYYDVHFDGSTTYIQTPLPDNFSTAFSVIVIGMFNNQPAGLVGTSNFEGKGYDEGFALAIRYGQFRFRIANASKIANVVSATAVFGEAVLVAGTFDGDTMKLYVDGELKSSLSGVGGYTPRNLDILIGKGIPDWTSPWYLDGKIYEVLIYNRALSDSEIQAIYADPLHPPTDGLVLFYAPDSVDTATNTWKDLSGNGNDGSIVGATPERVSIPNLMAVNIENNSIIPTVDLITNITYNGTTVSIIPTFPTLPYGEIVQMNVSAPGYYPISFPVYTTTSTITAYLRPIPPEETPLGNATLPGIVVPANLSKIKNQLQLKFTQNLKDFFSTRLGVAMALMLVLAIAVMSLLSHRNTFVTISAVGIAVIYLSYYANAPWGVMWTPMLMWVGFGLWKMVGKGEDV